ncbi:hypothetical protein T492DRAFT_194546 [Pavlovales sp. CCMP2436]|nr:hypothetical protein T492DRAFT_194546 [Pavlovales sp. CCMP2436]
MAELGIKPHLVCSAMGKTTNNLLAASSRALDDGVVDLSAVSLLIPPPSPSPLHAHALHLFFVVAVIRCLTPPLPPPSHTHTHTRTHHHHHAHTHKQVCNLHAETAKELGFELTPAYAEVKALLQQCEKVLEGVAMLGELSPRTKDLLVSFGERMSGRMVAAQLEVT